jgi:hypothetical protein
MARRILVAPETVSNWTSIAGAIEGILRFLGLDADQSHVMGTTGHAFRLAISDGPSGIASAGPIEVDRRRALALYQGLGFDWEWLRVAPDDRDYARRRKDAIARIRRSIDRGRPVAAYGLHLPEFGVVKGYDDRERLFFVSTTLSAQYGAALAWSQWPAPGQSAGLDVLLPGDRRRIDSAATEQAALHFALDYAERGEPSAAAETAQGLAAYDRWLAGFAQPGQLDPFGNARAIQTTQAARRDAARYLRAIAARRREAARAALEDAAAAYEAEALALSRLASLFPYPSGGDVTSAGVLAAGAASLRQALAHERSALAGLEAALAEL